MTQFPNARQAGDRVPEVTFRTREGGDWKDVTTPICSPASASCCSSTGRLHADLLVHPSAGLHDQVSEREGPGRR